MRSQIGTQDAQEMQGIDLDALEAIRRSSSELYGLLGALGERLYLEGMSLCDDEKEAAAWASANLVRSLEERRLLTKVAETT